MGLISFFDVNMPYGMQKNPDNSWTCFNREYQAIGFGRWSQKFNVLSNSFLETQSFYPTLNNHIINEICNKKQLQRIFDENGNITRFILYQEGICSFNKSDNFEYYFQNLKQLFELRTRDDPQYIFQKKFLLEKIYYDWSNKPEPKIISSITLVKGSELIVLKVLQKLSSDFTKKLMIECAESSNLFHELVPYNHDYKLSIIYE